MQLAQNAIYLVPDCGPFRKQPYSPACRWIYCRVSRTVPLPVCCCACGCVLPAWFAEWLAGKHFGQLRIKENMCWWFQDRNVCEQKNLVPTRRERLGCIFIHFFLIKKLPWTEMHIFLSCVRLFILLLELLLCRATGHVYLERWKKNLVSRLVCDLIYMYSDALLNKEWSSLTR